MISINTIWTIGHSTRTLEELIAMLKSFDIKILADIRHYPGSRRYPHFNKDNLQTILPVEGINYVHFKSLGGRRNPVPGSRNNGWRIAAFRGYADYMETDEFNLAIAELQEQASQNNLCYMCSEAVWWSCHRALVSDYLKVRDWKVMHIMQIGKAEEHPFTKVARIVEGEVRYSV
jgi:uncharacterized protein (DUF488 family)